MKKVELVEQVPAERIVWRSKGAKGYVDGAVTFHELTPDLSHRLSLFPSGWELPAVGGPRGRRKPGSDPHAGGEDALTGVDRPSCAQRAFPQVGRSVLVNENCSGHLPYPHA
jgi:hypothetical protein